MREREGIVMNSNNNETKLCKHCQSEIPKKAKVCPVCKRKQSSILKTVGIVFLVLILIGLFTPSDEETQNVTIDNNGDKKSEATSAKTKEVQQHSIEILEEYTYKDSLNWFTYHFIVVKNNSDVTLDVSTSTLAYGEDGGIVSEATGESLALGAGQTSLIEEAFETDKNISKYETELTSEESLYDSVLENLEVKQNDIEDGAVFQVTNNGEESAEFVEGTALFFKDNKIVGHEWTYFTDDDSELKPGKTISEQMTNYEEFDSIKFFLNGRR